MNFPRINSPASRIFSEQDLKSIVARSSRLSERLNGNFKLLEAQSPKAMSRLEQWTNLTSTPTRGKLYPPLAALGDVAMKDGAPFPPWTNLLQDLCAAIKVAFEGEPKRDLRNRLSVPFAHLLWPAAKHARGLVAAVNGQLLETAWRDLESQLVTRWSAAFATALQSDFLAFVAVSGFSPFPYRFRQSRDRPGSHQYSRFVTEQGADGLASFFRRYPTAARLFAELTSSWIAVTSEFAERFASDEKQLRALMPSTSGSLQIARIQTQVADSHRGGRCAMIVITEMGHKVVYKPRILLVEKRFNELLSWLNARGRSLPHRALRVVTRVEYGWMEFAEAEPCSDPAAIERFYNRAGSLLAIVHALQGIDIHRENLVAAGEHPVAVDLEALFHPPTFAQGLHASTPNALPLDKSVLRTGFLPVYQQTPTNDSMQDFSALGAPIQLRSSAPVLCWKNVNLDSMCLVPGRRIDRCSHHRPTFRKRRVRLQAYAPQVTKGFSSTMDLLRGWEKLPKFRSLIKRIQACTKRTIKRPTFVYNTVLRSAQQPGFLREGIDRSIQLQILPRQDHEEESEYQQEIQSLECLDIPYFINGLANRHGQQSIILSAAQTEEQVRLIRSAIQKRLIARGGYVQSTLQTNSLSVKSRTRSSQ